MNPVLPSTTAPRRRNRSGSSACDRGPLTAPEFAALYDDHAHPLYMLAHLLCQDVCAADAGFVVAMSNLGALPGATASDPRAQRRRLAAGLWQAVCGPPADGPRHPTRAHPERRGSGTHEPADTSVQPAPAQPAPACTTQEAMLGLTLLGGHTYEEAAHLIGLSPDVAARQLRAALVAERRQTGSPPADHAAGAELPSGAGDRDTGREGHRDRARAEGRRPEPWR